MTFDVETLHGRRATDRWNRLAVGDILERLTWSRPDAEALVAGPGACADPGLARLTYREADRTANRVANALLAEGLQRSDRVLLYCENSVEAVVTMLGIAKAGLVAVPVNPLLAPDVLRWAISHVDPSFAIVDAEFAQRGAESFAAAGVTPQVTIPLGGGAAPGTTAWSDWIADASDSEPAPEPALHADDVWVMLFTSGTTAMPKAAMSSHQYSYMAALSFVGPLTRGVSRDTDLVLATFLPIVYHCGHNAGVLPGFLSGGKVVLGRRFDPVALADTIASEGVTALWAGAPRLLDALAEATEAGDRDRLRTLRIAMFAWGALSAGSVGRLKALAGDDLQLLEVFGQSEAMSCYRFWLDEHPGKVQVSDGATNHVGVPNPILGADIWDGDGRSLAGQVGVPGEAVYRSPVVTSGYYRDEEATREAFRGGWFHSGDSCVYEPDGQQTMVDRYKDIIKTGGESVSSLRVESVVAAHPDVARAAVVGVPDARWGELVCAVVVAQDGARIDGEAVIAFCRERLAGYETPKRVEVVDAFPETVGGKILKYKLREALRSSTDS